MADFVDTANRGGNLATIPPVERANLTATNGFIVKVPPRTTRIIVESIVTSAGTASVKGSVNPTEPTNFTNFVTSAVGAQTVSNIQELPGGLQWVGIDPASGTWTGRIQFQIDGGIS